MDGMTEQVQDLENVSEIIQEWRDARNAMAVSIFNDTLRRYPLAHDLTRRQLSLLADMVDAETNAAETDDDRREIRALFHGRDKEGYLRFKRQFQEKHIPGALRRAIRKILGWELSPYQIAKMRLRRLMASGSFHTPQLSGGAAFQATSALIGRRINYWIKERRK